MNISKVQNFPYLLEMENGMSLLTQLLIEVWLEINKNKYHCILIFLVLCWLQQQFDCENSQSHHTDRPIH